MMPQTSRRIGYGFRPPLERREIPDNGGNRFGHVTGDVTAPEFNDRRLALMSVQSLDHCKRPAAFCRLIR